MCANILLSTDGSDVARKGVQHGIALAKVLNAEVTVITVTEPLPVDYGSGHASGRIPSQLEFDSFDAAAKERSDKVLMKLGPWPIKSGYLQNSYMFRTRTRPRQLSKRPSLEAAT